MSEVDRLATALNKALAVTPPEIQHVLLVLAAEVADALEVHLTLSLSAANGPRFEVTPRK
jgi:hypothetical protein